jgi:hypothetical protein
MYTVLISTVTTVRTILTEEQSIYFVPLTNEFVTKEFVSSKSLKSYKRALFVF